MSSRALVARVAGLVARCGWVIRLQRLGGCGPSATCRRWRLPCRWGTSRWAPAQPPAPNSSRPTTDRCPASAVCSSRTSSSGESCEAWWPPPPWSSVSTWVPSTWWCRSPRPARWPRASSASVGPGTGWASRAGAGSFPSTEQTFWKRPRWWSACTPERWSTPATCATRSMLPPSRSWPCAPWTTGPWTGSRPCCADAPASRSCPTKCCTVCSTCCRAPTRPRSSPS